MNKLKINKLGLNLAIANAVIVVGIGFIDNFNYGGGFTLVAILWAEIPATFIIMFLSDFIDKFFKNFSFPSLVPTLVVIIGGLQWYFVGWLVSKLKHKFFTRPK